MAEAATKLPSKNGDAARAPAASQGWNPFARLRGEIDSLFDEFATGWPFSSGRSLTSGFPRFEGFAFQPAVEVTADDKAYVVTAELPGLEEKDIEVTVSDGALSIRGEKNEETEEKDADYYLSERRYGAFERRFQLPDGVDADKIEASLKKGILMIVLPRTAEARKKARKVEVKSR